MMDDRALGRRTTEDWSDSATPDHPKLSNSILWTPFPLITQTYTYNCLFPLLPGPPRLIKIICQFFLVNISRIHTWFRNPDPCLRLHPLNI